jgi:hypothetical protein
VKERQEITMNTKLSTLLLSIAVGAIGCGDNVTSVTCGDNTSLENGMCVGTGGGGSGSGSGSSGLTCGSGTMDNGSGMCVATGTTTKFVQVEHLGRPGLNEALLITDGYLNGYNATAPSFAGVDSTTLGLVVGQAKTVLKAIYLGTCLLDGVAGITTANAANGLQPGGLTCVATGTDMFSDAGGTTLKTTVAAQATTYADTVFGLFEPDVMRIDTSVPSEYVTFCGTGGPGLCGGRLLTDDVIDDTLNFLLSGAALKFDPTAPNDTTKSSPAQFRALASDGVGFSATTDGAGQLSTFDTSNPGQGHNEVLAAFPYAAPPY